MSFKLKDMQRGKRHSNNHYTTYNLNKHNVLNRLCVELHGFGRSTYGHKLDIFRCCLDGCTQFEVAIKIKLKDCDGNGGGLDGGFEMNITEIKIWDSYVGLVS